VLQRVATIISQLIRAQQAVEDCAIMCPTETCSLGSGSGSRKIRRLPARCGHPKTVSSRAERPCTPHQVCRHDNMISAGASSHTTRCSGNLHETVEL
jgi:hypothetical protein